MRHLPLILLSVVLALPLSASAQPPSDQEASSAPARFATEVVVTPERAETPRGLVPAATAVLDAEAVRALPVVHLSEILSFMPGFSVARGEFHLGRPAVQARGFFGGGEAEYVLMLVDGVPLSDVESGLINFSLIPASSVQRIEAARGPGAALYGDSAVGGVIQILTDRRSGGGMLTATGGSFATFTADGAYRRQARGVSFGMSGAARRTDGGIEHANGREAVGTASADGRIGGVSWRASVAGDGRDRDDPGALSRTQLGIDPYASDPLYRFDTVSRQSVLSAFTLRHDSASWRPQARIYAGVRDEDLTRTILLVPGLGDRRARELSSANVGVSVEGEHAFGSGRAPLVRFGIDLAREHLDTSYREVDETGTVGALNSQASGRRIRSGMFASAAWQPVARARISGAIRWDGVDDAQFGPSSLDLQRAWSPRAGITVQLTESGSTAVFGQVSRAFKVPTLDQLFDPRPYPDFQGGTFTISNPDLVPQRATNVEAGITGGRRVRWSALVYRMTVDDEIDFDARTFSYANIGRSRHDGVELEAEGRWWKRVRPSASYALARVVGVDRDRQLKNVPRHLLTASAHVDAPGSVSAYVRYQRATGAFLDDDGVFATDGRSTLDVRVRRPVGRHAAFVDLLNVTGNVYEEFGFTLADFDGSAVPYAYPGAPRAVRAGLTLSF